ncbi:MAG TPA: hypothetical protein VIC56_06170 [Gemmatimonadota bacterium]|jgi:hypothetical protein
MTAPSLSRAARATCALLALVAAASAPARDAQAQASAAPDPQREHPPAQQPPAYGAPGSDSQALPAVPAELEDVRAALDKYRDWTVAVHDGYFSSVGCVTYPAAGGAGRVPYVAGGMGVHFLNPASIGSELDPARPQILIYEPTGDGLRLAAAEWFVPLATGVTARPALFGRDFDGPMEGHHPLMPGELHHYDLHVWLWKENPAGVFSPTNPALRCPAGATTIQEEAPRIVSHP